MHIRGGRAVTSLILLYLYSVTFRQRVIMPMWGGGAVISLVLLYLFSVTFRQRARMPMWEGGAVTSLVLLYLYSVTFRQRARMPMWGGGVVTSLVLSLEGEMSQPGMECNEQRWKRNPLKFRLFTDSRYNSLLSSVFTVYIAACHLAHWDLPLGWREWWLVKVPTSRVSSSHGLINYIDTKAKCCHRKNLPVKGLCGRRFSVWRLRPIPPPLHYVYVYTVYLFTQKKGVGKANQRVG